MGFWEYWLMAYLLGHAFLAAGAALVMSWRA